MAPGPPTVPTPNYANCAYLTVDSADDIVSLAQDFSMVPGDVYTLSVDYYATALSADGVSA